MGISPDSEQPRPLAFRVPVDLGFDEDNLFLHRTSTRYNLGIANQGTTHMASSSQPPNHRHRAWQTFASWCLSVFMVCLLWKTATKLFAGEPVAIFPQILLWSYVAYYSIALIVSLGHFFRRRLMRRSETARAIPSEQTSPG